MIFSNNFFRVNIFHNIDPKVLYGVHFITRHEFMWHLDCDQLIKSLDFEAADFAREDRWDNPSFLINPVVIEEHR